MSLYVSIPPECIVCIHGTKALRSAPNGAHLRAHRAIIWLIAGRFLVEG